MSEEKVTIDCPDCDQKLRFPIRDNLIRFSCPNCNRNFQAIYGKILTEDEDTIPKEDFNEKRNSTNKNGKPSKVNIFKRIRTWKIISMVFALTSIGLLALHFEENSERRKKEMVTEQFFKSLKKTKTLKQSEDVLKYLTNETKDLYKTFIQSQYKYKDSLSLLQLDKFIETLAPLDNEERRLVSYESIHGDTLFFHLNYKLNPYTGQYLIHVELEDFLR